jgi:hypothetical protein
MPPSEGGGGVSTPPLQRSVKNSPTLPTLFRCLAETGEVHHGRSGMLLSMREVHRPLAPSYCQPGESGAYEAVIGFSSYQRGKVIVIASCFQKKSQRTPDVEIRKAIKIV